MKQLSARTRRIAPGEILAFSCIRDEVLRLPWFLEYHRRMGVDHFFVLDNGSRDGSTDYLLDQADVTLYYTEDSYLSSDCGLAWLNELLERFAPGHWSLTVDADELLVYPGCETVSLRPLTRYLESEGADALMTMLLDMYSDRPIRSTECSPGEPFLDACPYFDADSYSYGRSAAVALRGGPRERAFWQGRERDHPAPLLRKIPLVSWRTGRAYKASTHRVPGVVPGELTGALLHFKFFGDLATRAARGCQPPEAGDSTTPPSTTAWLRQCATYSEVLGLSPDLTLFYDRSVRYRNSAQLVQLGILQMPSSFREILDSA